MTVVYTNTNQESSNFSKGKQIDAYDLAEEKKIIADINEEIKNELLLKWKKTYANAEIFPAAVAAMHPDVVDFLLGFNLVSVYDDIAKQANLDEKGRNVLPQVVWQVAAEKKWDGASQILEAKIALDSSVKTLVLQLLEQNILGKIKVLSEKTFVKKENVSVASVGAKKEIQLPFSKALEQYPKIGEQNVSVNPLKLKYFPSPVRPSLKNWITDFHDNMGIGKHSAVDRGNYLFHSENGKKLTPVERQKISNILKSLDENSPITIDPDKQVIVFEQYSVDTIQQSAPNNVQVSMPTNSNTQRPTYNNQQSFKSNEEQGDVFERYAGNGQAQKEKKSFFQKLASKNNVSADEEKKVERRGSFSILQNEKAPDQKNDLPVGGLKSYFQKPNQSISGQNPIAKPSLDSDNYFSNFNSNSNKQASGMPTSPEMVKPKNIDAAPISANVEDISALSGNISFSSPQKFSTEKNARFGSQWHIKPADDFEDENNNIEDKMNAALKNSRNNVVDLRN